MFIDYTPVPHSSWIFNGSLLICFNLQLGCLFLQRQVSCCIAQADLELKILLTQTIKHQPQYHTSDLHFLPFLRHGGLVLWPGPASTLPYFCFPLLSAAARLCHPRPLSSFPFTHTPVSNTSLPQPYANTNNTPF